jgi:hypothetical protein
MQMRHTLADDVVGRDEASFGVQRTSYGSRHSPDGVEQRNRELVVDLLDRRNVATWDHEGVSREQRPVVEECEDLVLVEEDIGGPGTGSDLAEHTG